MKMCVQCACGPPPHPRCGCSHLSSSPFCKCSETEIHQAPGITPGRSRRSVESVSDGNLLLRTVFLHWSSWVILSTSWGYGGVRWDTVCKMLNPYLVTHIFPAKLILLSISVSIFSLLFIFLAWNLLDSGGPVDPLYLVVASWLPGVWVFLRSFHKHLLNTC